MIAGIEEKRTHRGLVYFVDSTGEIVAKVCTCCGETVAMEGFYVRKSCLGGRLPMCKKCNSERSYKYNRENAEEINEQKRAYRKNNPDKTSKYAREYYEKHSEKLKERNRNYYENNTEKAIEYARKRTRKDPEKFRKYSSDYKKANPEKSALHRRRRRARKRGLPDTLTSEQWDSTVNFFGGGCALSGHSEFVKEHVIPIKIGRGGTTFENIIPMRQDLNTSKAVSHIFEWFDSNYERLNLKKDKFNQLIEYLADVNDMTVQEYRKYVDWCFDNPVSFADGITINK